MEEIKNQIICGDCLQELKKIPENSIDSIVTDPPYELGFMGKSWDSTGIANNVEMWKECLRVLKPGGHLLSFGGTRTYHRMASAIEDAGFEVRDMIEWVYGSGFPKSLNIADNIAKREGAKREGAKREGAGTSGNTFPLEHSYREYTQTENSKKWSGWGTALKPSHEPICMARKPLAEKTVAENCLKHGTGGINIDESRVGTEGGTRKGGEIKPNIDPSSMDLGIGTVEDIGMGRFPANLIHDNSEEVRECFPETKTGAVTKKAESINSEYAFSHNMITRTKERLSDSGNASRFFKSIIYQAKASKSERNRGCEGFDTKQRDASRKEGNPGGDNPRNRGVKQVKNNHPTVKPIALMEYLIKMVTPKGGIVLDLFMGSGSTGVACKKNGFIFIGIEKEQEYCDIARARIDAVDKTIISYLEKKDNSPIDNETDL